MNQAIEMRRLNNNDSVPYNLLLLADPSRACVDDYLKRGVCYVYGAAEILGVYVLLETRPHTAELVNIAVSEKMQGKGIGKAMILHAVKTAKAMGIKTFEVGTGNSSLGQLALYQKCGFRITGIDRNFFIRHYDDKIFENGIQCMDMIRLSMEL